MKRALIAALAIASSAGAQGTTRAGFTPLSSTSVAPALQTPISVTMTDAARADVIDEIARQASLSITFDRSLPGLDRRITMRTASVPAATALLRALEGSELQALASPEGQVVLVHEPDRRPRPRRLTGRVRDAESNVPLAGARIELLGTRFATWSRDDGAFSLGDVPAGTYEARVTRIGARPLSLTGLVVRSEGDEIPPLEIGLDRAPVSLAGVVVTPSHFGIMQPSLEVPQSLSREQIETMPQIGEDIYRAVNRLPGVTANDFSANFFVRGGSGDELYVTLDGLELIEPFHLKDLGGALSIIDAQAIGSVDLTTGGFSAEYGDRLTGVFAMRSIDPRTDRTRTSAGLSVMNARITSQGGFAGGRGGWLLSARRGYVDLALKLARSDDSLKPRYHDLFAKMHLARPRGGRVAAHVLHAGDNMRYLDSPDPSIRSRYGSSYAWLTWEERLGERLRQQTVASVGRLTWRRDGDGLLRGEETTEVIDRRSLTALGLRQDWSLEIAPQFLLKWGGDVRRESADYDYFAWTREQFVQGGDVVSVYDTTDVALAPSGSRIAAYVAPRVRLLPSLTVEGGLRYDRNTAGGDDIVSPRVNVAWQPRVGTSIRAAWGRYSQSQSLYSIQTPDGVDRLAPAERAEQRVVGVEQLLPLQLAARVEAYDRRLTNVRPRWVNAGPGIEMFPELMWDRLLLTPTSGRARGVELMLSHPGGARVDWSLGYALAKATQRVDTRDVPRTIDQRHTVSGDLSVHPASNKWRLSVGAIWHSGWPYTPTIVEIDTLRNTDREFSLFIKTRPGELNSARLASYRRLDLRWTRYFDTRSGRIALFLELYNALNSANPQGYDIDIHVSRDRQIAVMHPLSTMIPRLPTFGLSWEF